MDTQRKKFKLRDAILTVICVVFVAEAAAPVASIGNSQYFWWIFMIIAFLLPYGLIASELGTSYNGDGGLYDWIRSAYPEGKIAARASWCYWINFPIWMASLAVLCPEIIAIALGSDINPVISLGIQLAFVWVVVFISLYPVSDSVWILNGCAVIKVVLALTVGILGIYGAVTRGVANEYTLTSLLPSFDLGSLSYISVILFNFLGFEVLCTFTEDMKDPKKEIPKAVIIGGVVIAAIYLFCAFGIGVAIPTDEISTDSGLIDAMMLILGVEGGLFISLMAVLFLITLFGNMISWSLGVNNVAAYAADRNDMPAVFKNRSKKHNMPIGASVINGIVATVIVLIGALMPESDLFWSFFALNLVMFLLAYIPIFPAFLKLRRTDPDTVRPFKVSGSYGFLRILALVPMVLIIVSIIFTAVPLSLDEETLAATLPITIGSVISLLAGEALILYTRHKAR